MPLQREFVGRMSSCSADPGYENWVKHQLGQDYVKCDIYLDGVEQKHVVMFDTVAGELRRCQLDADGQLYVVDGEIATEVVKGVVRVLIDEPVRDIIGMGVSH